MSNTNQPTGQQLTPGEFFNQNAIEVDDDWIGTNMIALASFNHCMLAYAAQQTAALREELSAYESGGHTLIATTELAALREELETVKKQRDTLKIQRVKDADDFLTLLQERDEAVKLLEESETFMFTGAKREWAERKVKFLSRLSSGETKPEFKHDTPLDLGRVTFGSEPDSMEEFERGMIEGHKHWAGNAIPIEQAPKSPWISVEDRLPDAEGPYIICRNGSVGKFSYSDGTFFTNVLVGIKYVRMDIEDVTHWMPLPTPPESLTDKK